MGNLEIQEANYIFIEKNPQINGPAQFKAMLSKNQFYFL